MASNPLEAEATGQEFVTVTFSGTPFRVPLDVDLWPLGSIQRCRGLLNERVVVNHLQVAAALQTLLADQWDLFLRVATKRRQIVEATQVFAGAVGFAADGTNDIAFGAIPRILALLERWPLEAESDLKRFWGHSYPDRWRFQAGRRCLTLRQIYACLNLPPTEGALVTAMNGGRKPLSDTAIAVMDLFEAITKVRHPSRPMPADVQQKRDEQAAAEAKAREAYAERMKERSHQTGLATALANKRISERGNAHAKKD